MGTCAITYSIIFVTLGLASFTATTLLFPLGSTNNLTATISLLNFAFFFAIL
ncbi:hypothetical protein OENI_890004 [Oenococcus oeni]|nr:hypothetical protein OENI_890004 [Oenococcus oeni]